jgi:chromosome segregation ATPase
MSLEAAAALEKIKVSFDTIEKNTLQPVLPKQEPSPELTNAVKDMNEKLKNITDIVEKHKSDLSTYQDQLAPQSNLIGSVAKLEQSLLVLNKNYEGLEQTLVDLKKEVIDSSESQLKHLELKLVHRIESLESALAIVKENTMLEQSSNKQMMAQSSALETQLSLLKKESEVEKQKNERLNSQLILITKKMEEQDSSIRKLHTSLQSAQQSSPKFEQTGQAGSFLTITILIMVILVY